MSNSLNPQNLGLLPSDSIFSLITVNTAATLGDTNLEDNYIFSLPTASDFNKNIGEVRLVYDFSTFINDDIEPILLSLGADLNNNSTFDFPGELIGNSFQLTDINSDVNSITDLVDDGDIQTLLLSADTEYFVELENQSEASSNFYNIDLDFEPFFVGTIDSNDSFYCCDREDEKYYYDDLSGLTLTAGQDGLVVGSVIDIGVISEDFAPVIFLTNNNTGEVIKVASDTTSDEEFNTEFNFIELDDIEIEANTTYLVSIETREANQTGDYIVAISQDGVAEFTDLSRVDGNIDGNISSSQSINGNLETSDALFSGDGFTTFSDDYLLNGAAISETVTVRLESSVFDTYLEVYQLADDGTTTLLISDDDDDFNLGGVAGGFDSTLEFTVESGFDYVISAGGYSETDFGDYTLTTL